ncbi:ArgS-related anticodon-binding protein NrtL [Streptomyces carpinensis]|uniref:arginine--tRNA ligase n=1 Tax=Streptomyces carpinensis TaxID=66369 RepID=A0ABV1W4S0_9ACTN|nr:DALR anticodon-binding domain-containing protein [Streptomyces carpinensis]
MTPVELSRTVLHAVRRAVDVGELRVSVPERVVVGPPGPGGCGDYATNVALQLARPAGQPAQRVAHVLRRHLVACDGIDDVSVTGPGFLNISLRDSGGGSGRLVAEILRRGPRYGHVERGQGGSRRGVLLRCPCDVRAVVVTDVVARLFQAQGHEVRIGCDSPPPPEWATLLGVRLDAFDSIHAFDGVDAFGQGAVGRRRFARGDVRPVPVPQPACPEVLALGRDAGRWALLHPAGHDRARIDREHLVQRESNPLFRVRYAYARTRALRRNAADLGFRPEPGPVATEVTATSPVTAGTIATVARPLLTGLADHPRVLAQAAAHHAPDRLARHLVSVADAVLPLLPAVLPLGEEKPSAAHRARLALAEAAGTVLAGGLSLLGVDAPDHL